MLWLRLGIVRYCLPRLNHSGNDAGLLSITEPTDSKIAPIQGENGIDIFPISEVHETSIGKLDLYPAVLIENRGNSGEVRFVEKKQAPKRAPK